MNNAKTFIFIFIAIIAVYICGLPIDIMEIDAAQYATISYEMFESGEYLQLYCRGYDYLDKPPFLFWLNQVFFFFFGVHDWSFKLGSLLFILLGIYATYKLGQFLYNTRAGLIAACVLGSTQAWFLISHDVKTDGILASTIIFSVWQWKLFTFTKSWSSLLLMSVGISISMLTKGPIGLMVPILIMGTHLAVNKEWKMILNWRYLIAGIVILAALFPMLYGLYLQYDLHPGKTTSGGQVVNSGLEFYFWTQSFGRITGASNWQNNDSFFYFLPEIAWAFLPWTIFIIQSMVFSFTDNLKKNIIPLAGFLFPLIALSFSHFKLSHYIFICFPFIALMIGNYLYNMRLTVFSKILAYGTQAILFLAILFLAYCFNISWIYTTILLMVLMVIFVWVQKKSHLKIFISTLMMGIGLNFFLNLFIYPALLTYQASSTAGKEYAKREPNKEIPLIETDTWSFSLEFYAGRLVKNYATLDYLQSVEKEGVYWLYMSKKTFEELKKTNFTIIESIEYKQYPVTRLQLGFIMPNTREDFISKTYLVKVYLPEHWNI